MRSIICRHQYSRESSDEHELAPCRGRARRPPHASGPARSPKVGPRAWTVWRQFVVILRALARLMPTNGAPQGTILAWCAARRRNELRPPRGLDGARGLDRRLDLRRDFDKPRPSASARHQPPITPLSRPTLLTGQGLAQAEKPKPACSLAPHSSRASTGEERRIDLHPVLLRAGVLPRPDKLRASRERPAKLHEAPSSRQLRHVEPAGLASSSCCGTRSESVAERVGEHASGGLLSACHVFTGGTSSLCAQGSLGILATLQHNDAQLWKLNSPPVVLHQVGSC